LQFAHGFTIDSKDHLWVTDNVPTDGKGNKGQVVLEFDSSGKLLRTLGKPGIRGSAPNGFTEPNAVLIAPDGSIFVAQGHTRDYKGTPRVIKFDAKWQVHQAMGHPGRGARPVRHAALPGDGFQRQSLCRRPRQ
jgi:hypothetical protein